MKTYFLERVNEVFDANYYELSYIEDESNWKTYFYAKKSIPHPGDFMDCSFICKSVERDNGCEIFYFEVCDYKVLMNMLQIRNYFYD